MDAARHGASSCAHPARRIRYERARECARAGVGSSASRCVLRFLLNKGTSSRPWAAWAATQPEREVHPASRRPESRRAAETRAAPRPPRARPAVRAAAPPRAPPWPPRASQCGLWGLLWGDFVLKVHLEIYRRGSHAEAAASRRDEARRGATRRLTLRHVQSSPVADLPA